MALKIDEESSPTYQAREPRMQRLRSKMIYIILLLSLVLNAHLLYRPTYVFHHRGQSGRDRSQFAKLVYDTPVTWHNKTDFQSSDVKIRDAAWDNLDTSALEIIMDDETAASYGIQPTVFRFPFDETQGVYMVRAYHDLHCLKNMRHVFEDLQAGIANEMQRWHFYHCLDSLRQSTVCHADDTPMPIWQLPDRFGDTQVGMCRSFNDLVRWTRRPERSACYRRFQDKGRLKHPMEQFAFCPEDSPYYELQQAYFAKWGHKEDMYALEEEMMHEDR